MEEIINTSLNEIQTQKKSYYNENELQELSQKLIDTSLKITYQRGIYFQKQQNQQNQQNTTNNEDILLHQQKYLDLQSENSKLEIEIKKLTNQLEQESKEKTILSHKLDNYDELKKCELLKEKSNFEILLNKEKTNIEKEKLHAFHQGQIAALEKIESTSQEKQKLLMEKQIQDENFKQFMKVHQELEKKHELSEQELTKYRFRNQSGHVGVDFEDFLVHRLQEIFRYFFVFIGKTDDRKLDIEMKTADDIVIRIDTKKYSKNLPGVKVSKFVEDLDFIIEKKISVHIAVLYSNLPFAGQKPEDPLCKTYERDFLIIHEIGNNAEDILITKIHDSILQIRQKRLANLAETKNDNIIIKSKEKKELEYVHNLLESYHQMTIHQSDEIRSLSKSLKQLHGHTIPYYKNIIENARILHSHSKDILSLTLLKKIENYKLDKMVGGQYKIKNLDKENDIEKQKRPYKKRKNNEEL